MVKMDNRLLIGGVAVGVVAFPFNFVAGASLIGGTYIIYNMLRSSNFLGYHSFSSENVSETLTLSSKDEIKEE